MYIYIYTPRASDGPCVAGRWMTLLRRRHTVWKPLMHIEKRGKRTMYI